MSAQGQYYGVELFDDEYVAMYDIEQHLMGPRFKTEQEAQAFVDGDTMTYTGPNWEQRIEAQLMPDEQDRLIELLHAFVDGQDDECQFDHHGDCQNHYAYLGPFDCGVVAARTYLKYIDNAIVRRLQYAGYKPPESDT